MSLFKSLGELTINWLWSNEQGWTFSNKFQWNFNQNMKIFREKYAYENVVYKMATVLPQASMC